MEYELNQNAVPRGTSNQGLLHASPKRVKELFGEPVHWPGDTECLGNYIFVGEDGTVCALYCMAYDAPEANTRNARAEFWNHSGIIEVDIGAKDEDQSKAFRS